MTKKKDKEKAEPVTWFADKDMAQIYSKGLEFAFFNADKTQCHPLAYCKDFLQDAIWAELNKSTASIWSFTYEHGENPPLDRENTRMGVRLSGDAEFADKCGKALAFIRALEADLSFPPSELESLGTFQDTKNEVFVYVSDALWMHSPVLISLYTLALRVGMTYPGGDWKEHFKNGKEYLGSRDKGYATVAIKAFDKLLGKDVTKVFAAKIEDNYPKGCNVSGVHNNSGIVAFGNGNVCAEVKGNWSEECKK